MLAWEKSLETEENDVTKMKMATWTAAAFIIFAARAASADIPPPGDSGPSPTDAGGTDAGGTDAGKDSGTDAGTPAGGGGGGSSGCSVTPGIGGAACFSWLVAGIVPLALRRRRSAK